MSTQKGNNKNPSKIFGSNSNSNKNSKKKTIPIPIQSPVQISEIPNEEMSISSEIDSSYQNASSCLHENMRKQESPCTVAYLKPEYRILNICVELKDMTEDYGIDQSSTPPTLVSPLGLGQGGCNPWSNMSSSSSDSDTADNNYNRSSSSSHQSVDCESEMDIKCRGIEEQMYNKLCIMHDIVISLDQLEQYVLRELRHLQEYFYHKFPSIAGYLKTPFEEIILCVRSKTKGLFISHPAAAINKDNASSFTLSSPSPRLRSRSRCKSVDSGSSRETKKANNNPSPRERSLTISTSTSDTSGVVEDPEYGYFDEQFH